MHVHGKLYLPSGLVSCCFHSLLADLVMLQLQLKVKGMDLLILLYVVLLYVVEF